MWFLISTGILWIIIYIYIYIYNIYILSAKHYQENKERLQKEALKRYQNLSKGEKKEQ